MAGKCNSRKNSLFDLFTNLKWQAKQGTFVPRNYFFFTAGFNYTNKTFFNDFTKYSTKDNLTNNLKQKNTI